MNSNKLKKGVNILGYFRYQFGVAQLAKIIAACIEHTGIPYVVNCLEAPNHHLSNDNIKNISDHNIYPINIIVANALEMDGVISQKQHAYFMKKYNIGIWCWETEYFHPRVNPNVLKYFNEIWTISEFCKETISKTIKLPINVIKLPVILPENIPNNFHKIDKNKFNILFTFDYQSVPQRKNPLAVIEAFKLAFGNNTDVFLIIKSVYQECNTEYAKYVNDSINGYNNIVVFNESLSRIDMLTLINSCDVYISLHRSEGLGLGMKEAMAMGKIVIATNYSGNTDFMNENNSILIGYDKVKISPNIYPYYYPNVEWAEPNIYDTVEKLKHIYEDKNLRTTISTNAKQFINDEYNMKKCSDDFVLKLGKIFGIN